MVILCHAPKWSRRGSERTCHFFISKVISIDSQVVSEFCNAFLWWLRLGYIIIIITMWFLLQVLWIWRQNSIVSLRTCVFSVVRNVQDSGVFIWSLHLLCGPAALRFAEGASVVASANVTIQLLISSDLVWLFRRASLGATVYVSDVTLQSQVSHGISLLQYAR